MKAAIIHRTAGFLLALASGAFGIVVIAVGMGTVRQIPGVDVRLVVVPFLGYWSTAIPLAATGVWSGVELALRGWDRPFLVRAASILHALGLALFAFGQWQSRTDCYTYNHDGLCFLVGVFFCMLAIAVLGLGSLVILLRWVVIRHGRRPPSATLRTVHEPR